MTSKQMGSERKKATANVRLFVNIITVFFSFLLLSISARFLASSHGLT